MPNGHKGPVQVQVVAPPLMAWGLERMMDSAAPRFVVQGAISSIGECLPQLRRGSPDVVVVDLDGEKDAEALSLLHARTEAKILVITGSADVTVHDKAVLAGARGVVEKRESPPTLLKAIEKVHEGEIWIDRDATSRIFMQLALRKAAQPHDPVGHKIASLTRRERQTIAALVSDAAAPGKLIAERLHISEHTLRNHLTSIYSKLDVSNRVDLYAFAHRHGLARAA